MLNIEPIAAAEATRERGRPTAPSDIALELATNPFPAVTIMVYNYRCRHQGKHPGDSTAEVFAAVRGWKDSF